MACTTPYQPMGYSGGFAESRLDNGDYVVTVKVNGNTDRATALQYLHRRAAEICPQGFDFVDRASGDNGGVVVTRHFFDENHKPEEDAVVRCKGPPPGQRYISRAPRSKFPTNNPDKAYAFWCSVVDHTCEANDERCVNEPCVRTTDVWCAVSDADGFLCGPERETCIRAVSKSRDRFGECISRKAALAAPAVLDDEESTSSPTTVSSSSPKRVVVEGERPMFCASDASKPESGLCYVEQSECEGREKRACEARSATACFNAKHVLDAMKVTICSLSIKDCELRRANAATDADLANVSSLCGIYRVAGTPK